MVNEETQHRDSRSGRMDAFRSVPFIQPVFRILTVLVMALSIGGALQAQPAAADSSWPNISVCFRYPDGSWYVNKPVRLWIANHGTGWQVYRGGSTNADGCATWLDVYPNQTYVVEATFKYYLPQSDCGWHHYYASTQFGVGWANESFDYRQIVRRYGFCDH